MTATLLAWQVIDPEFCVFGPPGLDVGSLLSGFILAVLYRIQLPTAIEKFPNQCSDKLELREALHIIWSRYEEVAREEGISQDQIERIGQDSVGFAMMEVLRTSLGFAGARDPSRRIKDEKALERYQATALHIVYHCMMHRHGEGVAVLLEQLHLLDKTCQNGNGSFMKNNGSLDSRSKKKAA